MAREALLGPRQGGLVLGILVLLAVVTVRLGRMVHRPAAVEPTPEGILVRRADRVIAAVERREREPVGAGR